MPPPRRRANPDRRVPLTLLARRLTSRDIWTLEMLLEHTVLTSTHLTDLLTVSRRSVNRRLATLTRLGVIDSFRPHHRPGSAPEHYVLGTTGAALLAARYATTPAALGWHRDQATRAMFSPFLTHDTGTRTFFTHLTRTTASGEHLTTWWSERRCAQLWDDLATPDGYGQITGPTGSSTPFFVEFDTGTESLPRLATKLDSYAELATTTRTRPLLLFTLHSTTRETNLHQRLTGHRALDHLAVATTSRDQHHPADDAWLPVGRPATRTRLVGLPGTWPANLRPTPVLAADDEPAAGLRPDARPAVPAPAPLPPPHIDRY
ncbi:replication-relaxation family protein [Kitasatospora sp. NBC_01287]|uniref:replication-relaxation family protein n=1 Tax=Kitasatospora sp. NBC_01287 TaxID=2903573 RepID=UPI002258BBC9|nr:replication-relaxation family protein [Kitasatospora sp. NBC_01287]MCX4750596.1 replication-relaxation family protein [Kitasatospora sp. NBC_01287]